MYNFTCDSIISQFELCMSFAKLQSRTRASFDGVPHPSVADARAEEKIDLGAEMFALSALKLHSMFKKFFFCSFLSALNTTMKTRLWYYYLKSLCSMLHTHLVTDKEKNCKETLYSSRNFKLLREKRVGNSMAEDTLTTLIEFSSIIHIQPKNSRHFEAFVGEKLSDHMLTFNNDYVFWEDVSWSHRKKFPDIASVNPQIKNKLNSFVRVPVTCKLLMNESDV